MREKIKYEFWSQFDLFSESNKKDIIDGFIEGNPPAPWSHIIDIGVQQHILAQLLSSNNKCDGEMQCKDYIKGKRGLQKWYYAGDIQNPRGDFQTFLCKRLRWMGNILNLAKSHDTVHSSVPDLSIFPKGSWAIQVNFTLKKPYISKDDVEFYIIDNPVKKEWVFKVPYVAPSQWKGALRSAMVRQLVEWWNHLEEEGRNPEEFARRRFRLALLFGSEKGEEPGSIKGLAEYLDRTGGKAAAQRFRELLKQHFSVPQNKPVPHFNGSLHFYPTFFDRIGLEVINPHDRKTGAGKQPIYFECAPAGTLGVFTLLYVPPVNTDENTARADLNLVAEGVNAMLTQYGFGAKTSSGYGVAGDEVEQGRVLLNFSDIPENLKNESPELQDYEPPDEAFYKYLDEHGNVKQEFTGKGEGGLMSNSEYKQKGESLGGGSLSEFKRFRTWYNQHGDKWKTSLRSESSSSVPSKMPQLTFRTLKELVEISITLANSRKTINGYGTADSESISREGKTRRL